MPSYVVVGIAEIDIYDLQRSSTRATGLNEPQQVRQTSRRHAFRLASTARLPRRINFARYVLVAAS